MMKHLILFLLMAPCWLGGQGSLNMTFLGQVDPPNMPLHLGAKYNDCWGFRHANGTEIAVIGAMQAILFVNVTNPSAPSIIYWHSVTNIPSGTNTSLWRDFKTYGNYLYASADEGTSGLLIFDLSNLPTSVTLVTQTNEFWNRTHNIFIDVENARLYAAGSNSNPWGVTILNIINPTSPTLVQMIPLEGIGGGYTHDVYVRDNIAYCSHGSLGKLQIYDFSNLPNITILGSIDNYPEEGYNHSSWLNDAGTHLVMADETHGSDLKLVDVTDPDDISADDIHLFNSDLLELGNQDGSVAHNPFILGDHAFIAYYHEGVQVFDISDPQDINRVAYYDTYPNSNYEGYEGCWGVYPYLPSGNIIASDISTGLYILHMELAPLAIRFLGFKALRHENTVDLDWTIADASEGNTFEVERSTDGGLTFTSIGTQGLVNGISHYHFTDHQISDYRTYVYRIRFVQFDGKKINSPLRVVRTYSKETLVGVVNPFQQELILDFSQPLDNVEMKLFDLQGKLAWSGKTDAAENRMEISLPWMVQGSYLLSMQWAGGSQHVMVQKVN